MALSILAVNQAAQNLLDCVCADLARLPAEVPGLAGCPCRVFVAPGLVAADGCDSGCNPSPAGEYPGQLTVSVARIYSSDRTSFPRETGFGQSQITARDNRNCQPPQVTAVELLVTLFRCVPGPTNEGCPPAPAGLSGAAMQLHADMLSIQRAALCCYSGTDTTQRNGRRFVMGASRSVGPQGDCVGIEQRITTALDDCLVCPPVTP